MIFLLIYGQELELIKVMKVLKAVFYHRAHVIFTKDCGLGFRVRVWVRVSFIVFELFNKFNFLDISITSTNNTIFFIPS